MTVEERQVFDQVVNALYSAEGHLNYCGYGDSWERECAEDSGLAKEISEALEAALKMSE